MDEDNLRNWGYYEPPPKGLGLQLMSSMAEQDTKPFHHNPMMVSANTAFHPRDCMLTNPPLTQIDYVRDSWMNHRDKFMHMFPGSPSASHQMLNQPHITKEMEEDPIVKKEGKKRAAAATPKAPKAKKPKKAPPPKENGNPSSGQRSKRNVEVVINGVDMDITGIPIPVCTCTGTPQQCYRWGCGGWQSACCTMTISMYPLPMSTKRRGARIAGRKMSQGAFKKVLEKLASEGYNFSDPIDLKTYWAKHGTNKFVVIR